MNFITEITKLKNTKQSFLQKGNYLIISQDDKFYAVDEKDLLGKGASSDVYKAYPIDPKSGDLNEKEPLAAKYIAISEFKIKEYSIAKNYMRNLKVPILNKEKNCHILLMKYLDAQDLFDARDKPAASIKELTFQQRINLINEIVFAFNIIHHNMPTTGSAVAHGDVKGANIKFFVDPKTGVIDVDIMDFGVAVELRNENKLEKSRTNTTFKYKDIKSERFKGVKIDIYAMLPIFLAILGVKNPFALKEGESEEEPAAVNFSFEGLFKGYSIPKYPINFLADIKDFFKRMQNQTWDKESDDFLYRPSIDEVLQFTTSLNYLVKLFAESNNKMVDEAYIHAAKLILLKMNEWNVILFSNDKEVQTFAEYDFASHPEFCKAIVILDQEGLLELDMSALLTRDLLKCQAIIELSTNDLLKEKNKEILKLILDNDFNAEMILLLTKHKLLNCDEDSLNAMLKDKNKSLAIEWLAKMGWLNKATFYLVTQEFSPAINDSIVKNQTALEQIRNLGEKYSFAVTLKALKIIFLPNGFDIQQTFKLFLKQYIDECQKNPKPNSATFWSKSGEAAQQVATVEEILKFLDGKKYHFSENMAEAFEDSKLIEILSTFDKLGARLPDELTLAKLNEPLIAPPQK